MIIFRVINAFFRTALLSAAMLFPLIAPLLANAQQQTPIAATFEHTLVLRVREKGKDRAIRRAEIQWQGQKTFADKDGTAKITLNPSSNKVEIAISRTGFETATIWVSPNDTSAEVFLVSLQSQTIVVVRGKNEPNAPSKKEIAIEEARRVAPGGDAANIVKIMPGVQVRSGGFSGPRGGGGGGFGGGSSTQNVAQAATVRTGGDQSNGRYVGPPSAASNAGIVVRGSPPDDSRFFVDDLEVPIVFHNIVDLSVIPPGLLSDVQFEAGGFGSRYGNAGGGIVRLNTKSDIPTESNGEVVVNIPFYSGIFYRTRVGETQALSASFRRSYIDFFLNALLERQAKKNGVSRFSISPFIQDAHVMHTQKTDDGIRKVTLLYAEDGVKALFTRNYSRGSEQSLNIDAYTRGITAGVSQEGRWNDKVAYRTTPQYVFSKTSATITNNVIEASTHKLRAPTELEASLSESHVLTIGIDPDYAKTYQNTKFVSIPFLPSSTINIEQKNTFEVGNPSLWLSDTSRWGNFSVTASARASYNSQIEKTALDPRLSASYRATETNTVKASGGQYSKAPAFDQASTKFGNSDLRFERTYHAILGLETRWNDAYTTDIQAFLKEAYDVVEADRQKKYLNQGRREVWGVEFFGRRNLTDRFFGWLTYTYSKTIEQSAPGEPFVRSSLDQTHAANAVASYRFLPTWESSARYKYATGGSYSPSSGGYYDTGKDQYSALSVSAEKDLPAQQTITFYVTKDFLMNTWKISLRSGVETFWFKPIVSSMRANYELTKDTAVTSLSNIPFLEIQGAW